MEQQIIGISGISGAGKTTTAEALARRLQASLLHWDDFDELSQAPADYVAWYEAGKPEGFAAWKYPSLAEALQALKAGKSITCPRTGLSLAPSRYIVFDAPLGRNHEETGSCIDLWVHLDLPLDVALARRLLRDFHDTNASSDILAELRFYLGRSRPLFSFQNASSPDLVLDATMPTSQQVEQVVAALTDPLVIKPLSEEACGLVAQGFLEMGWSKPQGHFEAYYQQQLAGKRLVLVAYVQNEFAGYLTVLWQSQYASFVAQGIPEINDLNVLPRFRQKGVASRLLDIAERECLKHAPAVGLGVGLYADYGVAQRLYVRRGYRPDGCGVTYQNQLVRPGASVCVDDELILWFIKQGPPAAC